MFNVGDIVTGFADNPYAVTTSRATMRVLEVSSSAMFVKVLTSSDHPSFLGLTDWVEMQYFTLASSTREGLGTWKTQTGEVIKIADIELSHLLNIVALLYRKGQEKNAQRNKLVTLEKEVIKRLSKRVA